MKRPALVFAALIALTGAACTTTAPVVNYYTLDMAPSGETEPAVNIEVEDRLRAVEPLSKRNILIAVSPVQVEYYAVDEWAAGVDELVREKLEAEFGPYVEGRETAVLEGTILAFEHEERAERDAARVKLRAVMRAAGADRDAPPLVRKTYEERVALQGGARDDLVRGLSEAVARIAARMAQDAEEAMGS